MVCAFCLRKGIEDERLGANDLVRMISSFTAMIARILSHSGIGKESVLRIDMLTKECLHAVHELDARIQHKTMNSLAVSASTANSSGREASDTAGVGDDKSKDQWWLKSNCVSLLNLKDSMTPLGPLTNFWDGGGRGKRCIQETKPFIPRGVREGGSFFVVRLIERICKQGAIELIEAAACFGVDAIDLTDDTSSNSNSSGSEASQDAGTVNPNVPAMPSEIGIFDGDESVSCDSDPEVNDGDDDESEPLTSEEEKWSTPMEDKQMGKARTHCT